MFSYLLGIISVCVPLFLIPRPVRVYCDSVLDIIGYEEEMRSFSTNIDGIRYAWDVEKAMG